MKFFDGTARGPVDKEAALILSKPNDYKMCSRGIIKTFLYPRCMKKPPENITNYIGHIKGSLVVIGYLHGKKIFIGRRKNGSKKPAIKHLWQVRCSCGRYESRSNLVLRRKNKPNYHLDECDYCNRIRYKHKEDALIYWRCV